jgi:hypothetical protein
MQVLRGMALGLLGYFLFLSLIILGIVFTINNTALNPQFIVNEINKLDISSVVHETLTKSIPANYQPYIGAIDASIAESHPWITQQITYVVDETYDYLLSKNESLNITFSTQPLQQSLAKNLTAVFLQSPPSDYSRLTDADKQAYLARFQQGIISFIPSQIDFNPNLLGANGVNGFNEARNIAGYLKTSYLVLIAAALVLAFLCVWLIRDLKIILRSLGIICFISGALSSIAVFGLKILLPAMIPATGFPEHLRTWIQVVISDFIAPWGIFSLSFLIGGLILFIASFFLHPTPAAFGDNLPS